MVLEACEDNDKPQKEKKIFISPSRLVLILVHSCNAMQADFDWTET